MLAPSIIPYLQKVQDSAGVDLHLLINYSQNIMSFMRGNVHKNIKKQLNKPLGLENLEGYQEIINDICRKAVAALHNSAGALDLVRHIEEPLFIGVTQRIFGFVPECSESFLKDVDIGVKIAEPMQSVKTLLRIQDVFHRMIVEISELLKAPRQPSLIDDIHNALGGNHDQNSIEQIAATIAILIIASRTTSETLAHIIIANSRLPDSSCAQFSDPKWVSENFQSLVRFCASTEYLTRVASSDIEVEDISLCKNRSVYVHIPSVNRDSEYYTNCQYAKLDKYPPERHLGFGAGVHRCPGQYVAKQLITTFLPMLYSEFSTIKVDSNKIIYKPTVLAKRVASAPLYLS
jgi:cytochrome P450